MALPQSRNTTYSASDPPKSADLNDIQDQIVNFHGQKTIILPYTGWQQSFDVGAGVYGDILWFDGGVGVSSPGYTTGIFQGLTLPVGCRILSVKVTISSKSGGSTINLNLLRRPTGGPNSGEGSDSVTAAGDLTIDLTSSPLTVLADNSYTLSIEWPDETIELDYAEVVIDNA